MPALTRRLDRRPGIGVKSCSLSRWDVFSPIDPDKGSFDLNVAADRRLPPPSGMDFGAPLVVLPACHFELVILEYPHPGGAGVCFGAGWVQDQDRDSLGEQRDMRSGKAVEANADVKARIAQIEQMTLEQMATFQVRILADIATGRIAPREASALDRALRKRLEVIEQELREGSRGGEEQGEPVRAGGPLRPKCVDRVGDENANAEYDQADNRGVN